MEMLKTELTQCKKDKETISRSEFNLLCMKTVKYNIKFMFLTIVEIIIQNHNIFCHEEALQYYLSNMQASF